MTGRYGMRVNRKKNAHKIGIYTTDENFVSYLWPYVVL